MRAAFLLFRLAIADLLHDRLVSLCQIIMAAAVVAPLLLLFALKHGVATTLLSELRANPETLRIRPVGTYRLGEAFFKDLAARSETAFVTPTTRAIATQIYLGLDRGPEGRRPTMFDFQMLPSGDGDPIGDGKSLAPSRHAVSLSARAAWQLQAVDGDILRGIIERNRNGRPEPVTIELHVLKVLPEHMDLSATVYVHPDLLIAAERYRDGFAVPMFGWEGDRDWAPMDTFASFRLYARDLEDVADLADFARANGIEVRTDADRIAGILALDRNLNALFIIIGAIAAAGLGGALMANMVAGVERKRRALAVLGLLGFRRGALAAFPMWQAGLLAGAGFLLSLVLYGAGAAAVQQHFAPVLRDGQVALALENWHFAVAAILTLLLAAPPALVTGFKAAGTEPSEALREI